MKTLICPYCGCSLVRLGISKEKAATYSFAGTDAPTTKHALTFFCHALIGGSELR